MKRFVDLCLGTVLLLVLAIPIALLALAVKLTSPGPVLYWSDRIGRNNRIFRMPKFRTMRTDTPEVASHLLHDTTRWLTPIGNLLRRTSLDELPQLWSILKGDMSFVGPRPALHNQHDLIALRTVKGVHRLTPGLTGWAQINGRDESPIPEKVALDVYYLEHRWLAFDLKICLLTAIQVLRRQGTGVPEDLRVEDQGGEIPAKAFLSSAAVWFDQQRFDRCVADCDRAIAAAGDNAAGDKAVGDSAVAYNNRGAAWMAQGEHEKAVADFTAAIRRAPDHATAYHNRGLAYAETGEPEKAQADFLKVLELAPDYLAVSDATGELQSGGDGDYRDPSGAVLIAKYDRDLIGWKQWQSLEATAPHHDRPADLAKTQARPAQRSG